MSSILKSSDLIRSIKRRGFVPESQETFKPEDFLEMATEKININLMASLMEARGDYLVYFEDFVIEDGVVEYSIPSRAHGDKLREAAIVDDNGRVTRELTQISMEELTDYQFDNTTWTTFDPFYIQNNNLILLNTAYRTGDKLRMYFYMRPNKLVLESRAATASQVSSSVEVDSVSPKTGTITSIDTSGVVTSISHGLTTGQKVIIAGTDSVPVVDGAYSVTVLSSDTFTVGATVTTAGTVGSWSLAAEVVVIPSTVFPKHFTSDLLYDVVQSISPNSIKLYNVPANSINNAQKTISFRVVDVTKNGKLQVVKGDYITKAEETIVPNIPTEYHPLLAQMVGTACMEGMADEQQTKRALATLADMEKSILSIVSNRVEGAPKKIKNRNGTLASAVRGINPRGRRR
jgi:hypothetical protein